MVRNINKRTQAAIDKDAASILATLKETREAAGITQIQLAMACGMSRDRLASIEQGRARLAVVVFLQMCYALDTDPADIIKL